jgi:hypothetical protein
MIIAAFAVLLSVNSFISVATAEEQTPEQRQQLLEGSHLWSIYCNQCHNARPALNSPQRSGTQSQCI